MSLVWDRWDLRDPINRMFDETGNPWQNVFVVRGDLYGRFHANAYNADEVWERVEALYADDFVTAKKGIFEYILGGETERRLLNVRVFDKVTAKKAYERQTKEAKAAGVSNCPLCAVGTMRTQDGSTTSRRWKPTM